MIIGVTGTLLAGKSTLVDALREKGFQSLSLSDHLREIATARGLPHDRITLQRLGNELREKGGPSAVMRAVLLKATQENVVIDSVRTPGEVEALREHEDTLLIAIDADPRVRFDRAMRRQAQTGRTENATTFEEFMQREAEENTTDPSKQQLRSTIALADIIMPNNSDEKSFQERITRLLRTIDNTEQ